MPAAQPPISVICDPPNDPRLQARAAALADALHLPMSDPAAALALAVTPDRLEVRVLAGEPTLRGGRPLHVDLLALDVHSGAGRSRKQPIARALGLHRRGVQPPIVLDATAGLGEDAWLLASLGCRVLAVERHPIVAMLLADGLRRAAEAYPETAARLQVVCIDAGDLLAPRPVAAAQAQPEVIYLDPMYAAPRKTAARKPMRVLRMLVGDDLDAAQLLPLARRRALRRVVVKRPLRAAPLGGDPDFSVAGKALRYDVYVAPPRRA